MAAPELKTTSLIKNTNLLPALHPKGCKMKMFIKLNLMEGDCKQAIYPRDMGRKTNCEVTNIEEQGAAGTEYNRCVPQLGVLGVLGVLDVAYPITQCWKVTGWQKA
jgi:hypothetical protein